MNQWLRVGGWGVLALVVLWLIVEVVQVLFGIVSWVVGTVVSLLVFALVVYLGYVLVSRFVGGGGGSGGSRTREKERIFE